jgi:hypothetical protein
MVFCIVQCFTSISKILSVMLLCHLLISIEYASNFTYNILLEIFSGYLFECLLAFHIYFSLF